MEAFLQAFHKAGLLKGTNQQIFHDHFFLASPGPDKQLTRKKSWQLNYLTHLPLKVQNQSVKHGPVHQGLRYQV